MKAYWLSLRQMERSAGLYLIAWAVIAFGYFGIQAVLLNLYLLHLGYDTAYIGNFLASGQLIWAIAGLPAGAFGSRFGLRSALIAGFVLIIAGWTTLLLAEELPASALGAGLLVGWMISWLGAALMTVNGLPYQMGITTDANRGYIFSFQQAIQAISALLGGLVAGALPGLLVTTLGGGMSEAASYRAVLWLLPLVHVIGLLALLRARPVALQTASGPSAERASAPLGIFALFALLVFFQTAGEGGVRSLFNLYLHQGVNLPTSQIGTIFGLSQLAPLAAAVIIPPMLSRMSSGGALGLSTLLMSCALLILTISSTQLTAAAGMFFILLTSAIIATARSIFSQEIVQPRWRPMTSALGTIFMALGWASSSAYGGTALAQVGFHNLFRIGAVLVALAGLITFGYVFAARSRGVMPAAIPVTGEVEPAADPPPTTENPAVAES